MKKKKAKVIKARVNPQGLMGSAFRVHKPKKGKGFHALRLTGSGVNAVGVGDAGEEAEEAGLIVRVVEDFAIWQCCLQFINFFHRDIIGVQADFF